MGLLRFFRPNVASALALLLTLIAPYATHAQQPEPTPITPAQSAEARRLFEQGLGLADQERWGEAVEAFRQSRAITERPSTVFNLGNALFRVGRMTAAIAAFDDYLRIADARRDRGQIAEATRLRGVAQGSLATLMLAVSPESARVLVDGEPNAAVGARREIVLDPGRHEVRVTADDHEPYTTPVTLASGGRTDLAVRLAEVRSEPLPPPRPTTGSLLVVSSVRGATVRTAGVTFPAGEAQVLPAGSHDVVVTARGYRRFERTVRIEPGETTTLDATLARVQVDDGGGGGGGVLASPVFWIVTGVVVVGAGVAVGVVAASGTESFYGGTTGVVLR